MTCEELSRMRRVQIDGCDPDMLVDLCPDWKNGIISRLIRPMLVELVDEILVREGGDIEIGFKFRDAYEHVLEYIQLNKAALKASA